MLNVLAASALSNYHHQLKVRIAFLSAGLFCGVVAIVLSVVIANPQTVASLASSGIHLQVLSDQMQSVYSGFGTGFSIVMLIALIATIYLLLNKKQQARAQVRELDERNVMIQRTALTVTMGVGICACALACIVAGVFSPAVMFTLVAVILFFGAVYAIARLILGKRY